MKGINCAPMILSNDSNSKPSSELCGKPSGGIIGIQTQQVKLSRPEYFDSDNAKFMGKLTIYEVPSSTYEIPGPSISDHNSEVIKK